MEIQRSLYQHLTRRGIKNKNKNLNMVVEELGGVMFPVSTNKVFES